MDQPIRILAGVAVALVASLAFVIAMVATVVLLTSVVVLRRLRPFRAS